MILVDDVGSYPIEDRNSLNEYFKIYDEILLGIDIKNTGLYKEVISSFESKMNSGIDVICYPQLQDMHEQFMFPIKKYQIEPYLIDEDKAIVVEFEIVKDYLKEIYEKMGKKILLKVCVTGPIELYLKEFGNYIHKDLLENFALSVRRFLKKCIINEKYAETYTVSIDEPSIGFVDLMNISYDDITDVLNKVVRNFKNVQIHLHSLKIIEPILNSDIKIIGCEFASSPINMELISLRDLELYDKFLRAGIIRTDVDRIYAEILKERGKVSPENFVEDEKIVKKRFETILKKFKDRIMFIGPDCGLRGFPNRDIARKVLETVVSVKKYVRDID